MVTGSNYHAYIKLSEGCNQQCSFCAIPSFKGKLHSRELESITKEVKYLVSQGYFDFSFVKDLSLEDGTATLTEFTARIIIYAIKASDNNKEKIILCGGGRKNNFLVEKLKEDNDFTTLTLFSFALSKKVLLFAIS